MIRYVSGDILMSNAQSVAHGVAPNDDFGQGLAHTLRESLPAMYKDFRHYCQAQHPKAGGLLSCVVAGPGWTPSVEASRTVALRLLVL